MIKGPWVARLQPGCKRRRMSKRQDKKEHYRKQAVELFANRGFWGTSIREIATALDSSIPNIYHYFGSKEGLLLDILQSASQTLIQRLREATARDLDPLERFKLLLRTHLGQSRDLSNEAKIFLLDEEHLSEEGMGINLGLQREILRIYRRQLAELTAAGYASPANPTITCLNILGVINWQLRWYRPDGPLPFDEVVEQIVDFILHGVLSSGRAG